MSLALPTSPNLLTRLTSLSLQRWRALMVRGIAESALILAIVFLLTGIVDTLTPLSAEVRAVILVTALGAAGIRFARGLAVARKNASPAAIARLMESQQPKLNDCLSSAVEFLEGADVQCSQRFQRIAILRAENILKRSAISGLVPRGPARRALFVLILLGFCVLTPLVAVNTTRARVVLGRLLMPYGTTAWPTQTRLIVLQPDTFPHRIAQGDRLELVFRIEGVIPESLSLQFRRSKRDTPWEETHPLRPESATTGLVSVTIEPSVIQDRVQVKVLAGDTETAWLEVISAPAPKLIPREGKPSPQTTIIFPQYTRFPARQAPDGTVAIEAPLGSTFTFRAATDLPLARAELFPLFDRSAWGAYENLAMIAADQPFFAIANARLAPQVGQVIPLTISGSGQNLIEATFTPSFSGKYALVLTETSGLSSRVLLDWNLISDPAPDVELIRPNPIDDTLTVTPQASIRLRGVARDSRYAVRDLFLEYRLGAADQDWQSVPLRQPRLALPGLPALASNMAALSAVSETLVIDQPLTLARLPLDRALRDGDRLTLRLAADDYDTVSVNKERGRSPEIEFRIFSTDSLDSVIQQQLANIRPELLRLREAVRENQQLTADAAQSLTNPEKLKDSANALRKVENELPKAITKLADPRDGLTAQARRLQDLITRNQLPRTPTTDRVERLAQELDRVTNQHLNPAVPPIAAAREAAEATLTKSAQADLKPLTPQLEKSAADQLAAQKALDSVLKKLEQWSTAGELRAQARALKDQLDKADAAANKTTETIDPTKPREQLSPAEQKDLKRAAERLQNAADEASGLLDQAQARTQRQEQLADARRAEASKAREAGDLKAADRLEAEARQAEAEADALRQAMKQANGQQLVEKLRESARNLEQNRQSDSQSQRSEAQKSLDQFSEALRETPPNTADELAKKTKAVDTLDELANEQDELRKKVKQADQLPDAEARKLELEKLGREQESLRKKVEEELERLNREDQNPEVVEQLRRAAGEMKQAEEALKRGETGSQKQEQALDRLDQSADRLDQERQQDQQQLSREQRDEITKLLQGLHDRLKSADAEAERITQDVLQSKSWTPARLKSLSDLEALLKNLGEELSSVSEKHLEPHPVFQQLVDQAAIQAGESSRRLGERTEDILDAAGTPFDAEVEKIADDRSRRPLRTAIRRIGHVLDALKEDPKNAAQKESNSTDKGMSPEQSPDMPQGEGTAGNPPRGIPPLAQIKALRSIQAELNERTTELSKRVGDPEKVSQADQEELKELRRSQQEVAELFKKLAPQLQNPLTPEVP